jgi:hypothetical protein
MPVNGYMISGMLTRGKNCEDGVLCAPKLSEVTGGDAVYPRSMRVESLLPDRPQRSPPKPQWIVRLAEDGASSGFRIRKKRSQRRTIQFIWHGQAEQFQDRGHNVCGPDLRVNLFACVAILRQLHNQGNVRSRIVQKNAMRIFMVLAKTLAVVSNDHDQRAVVPASFLQVSKETAQCRVRIGNLAIV